MKLGIVSGDGLPVSGLLTIFRNVVVLGTRLGLVDPVVPADLGYSWRPDKGRFYPDGAIVDGYPEWLEVVTERPEDTEPEHLRLEWRSIRDQVADPARLSDRERADLRRRIAVLAQVYEKHFATWLADNEIDWAVAVNMTLSDAVPVTLGLNAAVRARYGDGRRPGGVLFWDHDLFGSCSIFEHGSRIYPAIPNEFTPVPQDEPFVRWAVVSDELAKEAAGYPTRATPLVVPNILPTDLCAPITDRHQDFASQQDIDISRQLILCPVRVFRVKGVELSIDLLAATKGECDSIGMPAPYLLIFGSLDEDPEYAREIRHQARTLGLEDNLRFLDGVPLGSYRRADGRWVLDEVDLLRLANATNGMVFFTPSTPDVETIGLGPALASLARLPCATTSYTAFGQVYGSDYRVLRVGGCAAELRRAGSAVVRALSESRSRFEAGGNGANTDQLKRLFPEKPWSELLHELHTAIATVGKDTAWQRS